MIIYGSRATAILYNYLRSTYKKGYYLLPVNICPIVPIAFCKLQIPFRFIDIDQETLCIDQGTVLSTITDADCTGVLFVNSYGIPKSFDDFFEKVKQVSPGISLIEDKCLSRPSFDESSSSPHADITLYSTGYSKYVDIGYGGFAILKEHIAYKHFELDYQDKDMKIITGEYKSALSNKRSFNYKVDNWLINKEFSDSEVQSYREEVNAELKKIISKKANLNRIYKTHIPSELHSRVGGKVVCEWRFNLMVPNRDALLKEIFNHNLFASAHYEPLNNLFPDSSEGKYPVAQMVFENVLNLFNDRYYTVEKALSTANTIIKFYKK